MRRVLEILIAAAAGAAIALAVSGDLEVGDSSGASLHTNGIEDLAAGAVWDTYSYNPEVACPPEVPAERGYTFDCEALVKTRLIPVTMRVTSPLGFFEVVRVGDLVSLP